jgi:hypothetical protein
LDILTNSELSNANSELALNRSISAYQDIRGRDSRITEDHEKEFRISDCEKRKLKEAYQEIREAAGRTSE